MTDEEKRIKELADGINVSIEALKSSIDEKASVEALDAKHTEITDKLEELAGKEDLTKQQEQLDEISTQLKQLEELQGKTDEPAPMQVLKHLKSEEFQNKIKAHSGRGELGHFEVKASSINVEDVNVGAVETQTEPGVSSSPWRGNPVTNAIRWGTIGAGRDSVSWWERTSETSSADTVTEEAAPAAASAMEWTKQSLDIMMIKDYTKVTRTTLEDFEYINSEINDLMSHGIPRLLETELLSGAASAPDLTGITGKCKAFACPANFDKRAEANNADVLQAAILQAFNGNTTLTKHKGYVPNLILVNPGAIINLQGMKKADGTYLLPPFMGTNGVSISGVRLVPSLDLGADTYIVGDFNQAKAYMKRNMRISFHYENEDDAIKDLVLVLASIRVAGVVVKAAEAYGFVTGTFAASRALIEEVTA